GDGTTVSRAFPTTVAGVQDVASADAGTTHTCALLIDGTAKCWGYNLYGQLGDGTTTNRSSAAVVSGISGAVAVSAGDYHTCAVLSDGTASCWGDGGEGALGDGVLSTQRTSPAPVPGLAGVARMSTGGGSSCALLADGTARCWGSNFHGQVGNGVTSLPQLTPTAVVSLAGAVAVVSGFNHTCAVLATGATRCWGYNSFGQVGDLQASGYTDRGLPVAVAGALGTGAVDVTLGESHSCALLAVGAVQCWGYNAFGSVGDGTTTNRVTPVTVGGLGGVVAISSGTRGYHTCALISDGTVKCWGLNNVGQLGDGTTTNRSTPVTVPGLGGAVGLAVGSTHSCVLLANGSAKCWGRNDSGQLGDGSIVDRPAPTAVSGLSTATSISGGGSHTCALLADRTATCWGSNPFGQLGDNTTTTRLVPTAVTNLAGATSLQTGYNHTCATLGDATVRCWGANGSGQLGDLSTTPQSQPVLAVTAIGVSTSLGGATSCVRSVGGTVKCWGAGDAGQLGNGTATAIEPSPSLLAPALPRIMRLASGNRHSCAVVATGSAYCWGDNLFGVLGTGAVSGSSLSPAEVFGLG
ncbi:MAG: RCC1 repeat-containing protein, partial [Actinomycetes bacterium]